MLLLILNIESSLLLQSHAANCSQIPFLFFSCPSKESSQLNSLLLFCGLSLHFPNGILAVLLPSNYVSLESNPSLSDSPYFLHTDPLSKPCCSMCPFPFPILPLHALLSYHSQHFISLFFFITLCIYKHLQCISIPYNFLYFGLLHLHTMKLLANVSVLLATLVYLNILQYCPKSLEPVHICLEFLEIGAAIYRNMHKHEWK